MKKRFARPLSMAISVAMMSCMLYLVPLSNYVKVDALMPYQDISLSFEERAADLVSRMTLSEKEKQIANSAPAITRLGVPSYNYWNEGLHGVANINQGENATSFPYSLGMAASWDRELVREVMTATADEARGFNQLRNKGLTYWSPTINLARDPRWGRNHESFGEDPYLTAQIGQSFVEGFQGDHEKYIKIVSTPKHYAANNSEYNRHKGTSNIDDRNLREYYTRAFRDISLNTNVGSVMSAYNRVNEVPASAHRYLLNDLLRKTWGFTGFIVSDCGAINNMYETFNHNWRPSEDNNRFTAVRVGRRYVDGTRLITPPGATALSLMAGTDMDCGSVYPNNGVAAVNNGLMSEHDMDIALVRIFTARMKLGEFDPTEDVPYRDSAYSYANQITSKKHKQLAEDSADQSIVLLKNQKARSADTRPILPLDKNKKNVVLVGPSQIATNYILGAYSGIPFPEDISTPRQGIANVLGLSDESQVTYLTGGSFRGTVVSQVRDVNLVKDGENVRTLRPADHSSAKSRGIVYQLNENRFGYIEPDSVIVYENIDITEIDSIAIETRGEGGTAQFYMYSETGSMMVASTSIGGSTPNDTIYNLSTANIGSTGGYNVGELHVVFVLPEQQVNLSPSDQNTIANADAVIVAIGSQGGDSSEGLDRGFLSMRRMQGELAKAVWELNPNTVVHIQSVGMLDLSEFVDDVPAILWCAYNGQAQGNAMARVIFGDANPTAKLPFTWYADEDQLPTIDDYHIRGDEFEGKTHNGWTYQYFTGDTTYPFGHGLTYSSFEYTNTTIDKTTVTPNDTVTVTVDVENTGGVDSAEIVQMYVVPPVNDRISRPAKQLKGFDKVKLAVGEKKTVTITYDLADMYFWDEDLQRNTHDQGDYIFQIGASSDDIRFEETVSLYGIIDERLLVVGAHPDRVILDASKPGARINSGIVASLRDDRWLDLARSDVTVTYTSGDESVAIVDGKGIVTPTGEGVTTITAAVSFGGDTMTADFPVVVFMDDEVVLTGISVDGKLLRGFEGRVFSYDYAVPFAQTNIPAIHAYAQDGIEVAIRQTTAIPGTASITASRGGVSVSYTIHFNRPPTSDNFMSGVIGSQWSIVRPNSSNYRVNQNGLQITTVTNQDIQASTGTNSNMFLQSGFGDWTVTTDIVVENVPNTNWQQMGIVVYEDTPVVAGVANAFIKFVIEHSSNLHILMVGRRTGQNTGNLSSGNVQINTGDVVTMRLNREGNVYTAYYSVNGGEFNRLGTSITYPMENVKVGFTAFSSGSSPPFNTTFKNFNVELPSETVMDEAELSDITLDGQGLQGFDPIIREYTVLLEDGAQPPIVRAVTSGITSEFIEIEQTEQAPGRAVVSYGVGSAWRDYVINFAYGSQHGITYMPNGAAGEPITDQSLAYNDTYYTNLNTFVNTGRTFIGWNTEPDGSGMPYAENEEIAVKESMTLYAIWKADNDTTNVDVTFDTQAAGVGTPSAKIVTFGSRYGELPIVNRAGYSFNGWFTHQNSGKEITGEKIVTNPANHTLYARWGRNVTVSFDTQAAGVGVPTPNSIQVIEGRQYGKLPVPVRRGYAFDGWFTQRSGGTKINAISTVTNNANHTLYAGWTAVTMRISFNTQTADVANPPSVIASFGDNYGTLPVPNRDEYIWGGWYTQPTGGTAVTEMTVIADASNHTLFARWTMEGEHAKGDVNGDGIVNIFDMILIRDHIVGRTILPARSLRAADAVADDIIDVKDIIAIRDSILGVVRL